MASLFESGVERPHSCCTAIKKKSVLLKDIILRDLFFVDIIDELGARFKIRISKVFLISFVLNINRLSS